MKSRILGILCIISLTALLVGGCSNKGSAQQQAQQAVLNDLQTQGYPTGMLGGTWYMTPDQLKASFPDLTQAGPVTYGRITTVYDQTAVVQYNFNDGLLNEVIAVFDTTNWTIQQFAANYDRVQALLSSDYGPMPQYTAHDLSPSGADQDYRTSDKWMGRVEILHVVDIVDHLKTEEYIDMLLGSA